MPITGLFRVVVVCAFFVPAIVSAKWEVDTILDYSTRWQEKELAQDQNQDGNIQYIQPTFNFARDKDDSRFYLNASYSLMDNRISDSVEQANRYKLEWDEVVKKSVTFSLASDRQQINRPGVISEDYFIEPEKYQTQDRAGLSVDWEPFKHAVVMPRVTLNRVVLRDEVVGVSSRNVGQLAFVGSDHALFHWSSEFAIKRTHINDSDSDSRSRSAQLLGEYRVDQQQNIYLKTTYLEINAGQPSAITSRDHRLGYRYKPNKVFSTEFSIGRQNDAWSYGFSLDLKRRNLQSSMAYQETTTTIHDLKLDATLPEESSMTMLSEESSVTTLISTETVVKNSSTRLHFQNNGRRNFVSVSLRQTRRTTLQSPVGERSLTYDAGWRHRLTNHADVTYRIDRNILQSGSLAHIRRFNRQFVWDQNIQENLDLKVRLQSISQLDVLQQLTERTKIIEMGITKRF